MPDILRSDDFGLKIYDRFPPKYREDDAAHDFALKRYIQSASDGGFTHIINDANGILNLIDPDMIDAKLLPILFRQYGLELFNGIPENYLRYLLPKIGEAWARKGSLGVVEFITSAVSGVKATPEITYDSDDNPFITVKLEMDYNIDIAYFPKADQLSKLLVNFIPFYCDLAVYYAYLFYESDSLKVVEELDSLFSITTEESCSLNTINPESLTLPPSIFGEAIAGISIFGYTGDPSDYYEDSIKEVLVENYAVVNPDHIDPVASIEYNTSNVGYIIADFESYSVIKTSDGKETHLDY